MVLMENTTTGEKQISDYETTNNNWITLTDKQYKSIIQNLCWVHYTMNNGDIRYIHGDLTSIGKIILNKIIKGE